MKISVETMGIPAPIFIGLLPLVIVGFYFNFALVGMVMFLIASLLLSKVLFKNHLKLETTLGPLPFKTNLLIKGIDETFLEKLDQAMNNNEKIVFSCPDNPLLKNALYRYVECQLGQCSFEKSQDISFKTAPLDINVKIISCPTRQDLELGMSILKNRGWISEGKYAQQSGLFNTVHTQKMIRGN
jgi:hypothetical protein